MRPFTIAAIASILSAAAFGADALTYPVIQGKTYKFEKVADGVYYATGGSGSNNVVIVNDQDVLLVDDGTTPAAARAFLEDIKKITSKPVRYVVNTHFHYDHTDGNSVFGPEVQIIAHEYVRTAITTFNVLNREPFVTSQRTAVPARIERLAKQFGAEQDPSKRAAVLKDLAAARITWDQLQQIRPTPPNVTYTSKMVLFRGSREIQLLFLGRGHTAGDTVVFLPAERIVCTGDLMESQLAYMGDGFFDEWVTTLDTLKKLDFALLLPGHGTPFSDKGRITAFQSYLSDITVKIASLRAQGMTAEQAASRVDLTSHSKDFPQIKGPGADLRGVRRIYAWMDERGKK